MKILRKGDQFIKMPDSTQSDLIKIHTMTERGWEFAQKKEYKVSNDNTKQKVKDEVKKDKETKKEKEVKKDKEIKKDTKKDKNKK